MLYVGQFSQQVSTSNLNLREVKLSNRATDYRFTLIFALKAHPRAVSNTYCRHVIKAKQDTWNILTNGAIFSAFKHYSDLHTARGRSTLKDGVRVNECIFRNSNIVPRTQNSK